jgi:spermidine synthase
MIINSFKSKIEVKEISIFLIMGVLAACGLVYEYLMSHYAARMLGAMETTIYGMIGVMVVSMGVGSLYARNIKNHFQSFVYLELSVALIGSLSTTIIAIANALVNLIPKLIGSAYDLPADAYPQGGWIESLSYGMEFFPFLMGAIIGVLVGMEIPLIARVREHYLTKNKEHNAGTIYGADYIGAGVGATLWVMYMVYYEPSVAAAMIGAVNLIAGLYFMYIYSENITKKGLLVSLHFLVAIPILFVYTSGATLDNKLEDILYKDEVIFSTNTQYQRLTLTKRNIYQEGKGSYSFYINGRTQFNSSDEEIYHSMLTEPVLKASARNEYILIIGGGDGLAARNVLRKNPKKVILADLDENLTDLFREKSDEVDNSFLLELNNYSLSDERLEIIHGDAYNTVIKLLRNKQRFDSIIVDLPDPSHPNLNKLYSVEFYSKLRNLLKADGAIGIQSTSPYHAKNAFISIGKTVEDAGFEYTQQYHTNVPSFGEWGWTIATKYGSSPYRRIEDNEEVYDENFITKELLLGSFNFPKNFYKNKDKIKSNRLNSMTAYRYHENDWEKNEGVYQR